jgi:hypothetical protein
VPLTFADRLDRLAAVATEHMTPAGVFYQRVHHDDGCAAIRTQSLRDCECEPWFRQPERIA